VGGGFFPHQAQQLRPGCVEVPVGGHPTDFILAAILRVGFQNLDRPRVGWVGFPGGWEAHGGAAGHQASGNEQANDGVA
jgi:hypothetical protein